MTTLENQNFVKQENVADLYSPATTAAPPYQNFAMQFQVPNYVMPSTSQPAENWVLPEMNEQHLITASATGNDLERVNAPWSQQQQQGQRGTGPQRSYDQLFGEDWGGVDEPGIWTVEISPLDLRY